MRNGLEEFVAVEGEPFRSPYASILWGRLEPGTRLGYVAALQQFLRYSRVHGWLFPREALEGQLLEIARDGYFEGPVKKVLSGLRKAKKAGVIQSLVKVAFGEWSALQWWGTWVRREIRELGSGSAEKGAILGTVDVARKRRRANSTRPRAFRFDLEAMEDSTDEGEGIADAGDQ